MLYTDYVYLFQAAGLILLVAMIGAIVLTLRERERRAPPEHLRPARPHARTRRSQVVKVPAAAGGLTMTDRLSPTT